MLLHFVEHRHEVVVRRSEHDLKKAEDREHILEGLKVAVDNIDEVIELIRGSNDTGQAQSRLQERFEGRTALVAAVLGCKLERPGIDGVYILGSGNRVEKCRLTDLGDDGIDFPDDSPSAGATLVKNTIKDAEDNGINLEGGGHRVEKCKLSRTGSNALELLGAGGHRVEKCKISKAGGDGILAIPASGGNTLVKNKVSKTGDDGIDLESDGNTCEKDKVKQAEANGCELDGDDNTLTKVKAAKSGDYDLSDRGEGNTFPKSKFKTIDPDADD